MAKIFRLQNNVPDVYTRKSRDFQLLCNVFDVLNSGVKFDIDSMTHILDARYCNESLLPHLQTKLGFFTNKTLSTNDLRTVLSSFSEIVKNKGSNIGIKEAIEVYLKVINASKSSRVLVINKESKETEYPGISRLSNTYVVEVSLEGELLDVTVLDEILKYVLPAGYKLKYTFYSADERNDIIEEADTIRIIIVPQHKNATIARRADSPTNVSNISTTRAVEGSFNLDGTYTEDEYETQPEGE